MLTPPANPAPHPLNVTVLLGGPSAEREVSLASGQAVVDALGGRGHHVRPIDPAETDLNAVDWTGTDCAFIALHGQFGEDGQVQEVLQRAGVSYTGSGPEASRLAMNKRLAKERFLEAGIPTPAYACFGSGEPMRIIAARADRLGYPLVVKPIENGSSLGISIVREPADLAPAVASCFRFESTGLVERYVAGREMTVGILNDRALPVIELRVAGSGFYDFDAKYVSERTRYEFDLDLSAQAYDELQRLGEEAHRCLGCRDFSRVDVRLDRRGRPFVLEVNTIPGLTGHSLLPKAADRAGLSFAGLCETMVRYAIRTRRIAA